MYLVMAVTVKGRTGAQGATTTNRLVNINDFFTSQVCSCARVGLLVYVLRGRLAMWVGGDHSSVRPVRPSCCRCAALHGMWC